MACPKCFDESIAICDNDCGTYSCMKCECDFYCLKDGSIVVGHLETCGNDSDFDSDSNSNSDTDSECSCSCSHSHDCNDDLSDYDSKKDIDSNTDSWPDSDKGSVGPKGED